MISQSGASNFILKSSPGQKRKIRFTEKRTFFPVLFLKFDVSYRLAYIIAFTSILRVKCSKLAQIENFCQVTENRDLRNPLAEHRPRAQGIHYDQGTVFV